MKRSRSSHVPRRSEALPAVLDHMGKRWRGTVLHRDAGDAVVETALQAAIGGLFLCQLFGVEGEEAVLVLDGSVVRVAAPRSVRTGRYTYNVRWRWAYLKTSREVLRERLVEVLGVAPEDIRDSMLTGGDYGALYAFDPSTARYADTVARRLFRSNPVTETLKSTVERPRRPEKREMPRTFRLHRPFARIRAHARVDVGKPCRYVVHGQESTAWLRDVSREGAFISTRWRIPDRDTRVIVSLHAIVGGFRREIVLSGTVRWRGDDPRSCRQRGFGLYVDSVVDGDRGRHFQRYLDEHLGADDVTDVSELIDIELPPPRAAVGG